MIDLPIVFVDFRNVDANGALLCRSTGQAVRSKPWSPSQTLSPGQRVKCVDGRDRCEGIVVWASGGEVEIDLDLNTYRTKPEGSDPAHSFVCSEDMPEGATP